MAIAAGASMCLEGLLTVTAGGFAAVVILGFGSFTVGDCGGGSNCSTAAQVVGLAAVVMLGSLLACCTLVAVGLMATGRGQRALLAGAAISLAALAAVSAAGWTARMDTGWPLLILGAAIPALLSVVALFLRGRAVPSPPTG